MRAQIEKIVEINFTSPKQVLLDSIFFCCIWYPVQSFIHLKCIDAETKLFECMSFNEEVFNFIENSLELFQLVGPTDKKSALVYTMVWCHLGDKPYLNKSWPSLPTH